MGRLGNKVSNKGMGGDTLKFLVDYIPYNKLDCPFNRDDMCALDKRKCKRFSKDIVKRDVDYSCRWLREEKR